MINTVKTILATNIPLDAKMILLHLYPQNLKLTLCQMKFLDFSVLQAKRLISRHWKQVEPPTMGAWVNSLAERMAMERITYFLKNKLDVYKRLTM